MGRFLFLTMVLILALVMSLSPAQASSVNGDGYYTGNDGYYYYDEGGTTYGPYYRKQQYYTYYAYGKAYYAYYYSYYPINKQVTYTDPDWRSQLLKIAQNRDKIEGKLRLNASEQKYFLEAVEALGLAGQFRFQNYGADPYGYNSLSISPAGYQGKTITGYSLSTFIDAYGNFDRNILFQQASRHTQNAQQLAGQATTDFAGLVQQEGNNSARVAEILAKGEAAAKVLQASKAENQAQITTREFRFQIEQTPDGKVEVKPIPEQQATIQSNVQVNFYQVAALQCASCHAGSKPKGNFDVFSFATMKEEDKKKVRERLTTQDAKLRMPRNPDGTAGQPLHKSMVEVFK